MMHNAIAHQPVNNTQPIPKEWLWTLVPCRWSQKSKYPDSSSCLNMIAPNHQSQRRKYASLKQPTPEEKNKWAWKASSGYIQGMTLTIRNIALASQDVSLDAVLLCSLLVAMCICSWEVVKLLANSQNISESSHFISTPKHSLPTGNKKLILSQEKTWEV